MAKKKIPKYTATNPIPKPGERIRLHGRRPEGEPIPEIPENPLQQFFRAPNNG